MKRGLIIDASAPSSKVFGCGRERRDVVVGTGVESGKDDALQNKMMEPVE